MNLWWQFIRYEAQEEEEEVDDDMSQFQRSIENWSTLTEDFPLPIQPFCPTLRTMPEAAQEGKQDDMPFCIFRHLD